MYPVDALKIIRDFRNRQGNSKDDIEAFDIAIKYMVHYIRSRDMYLDGYVDGFDKAKQLYGERGVYNENK